MSDTESFEVPLSELMGYCHDSKYATMLCYRLRAAHDREIRDVSQQQYHRGFEDGQHSMDAEHRAIVMRLRQLPRGCTGYSDAHTSWFADLAWAMGIEEPTFATLRDELVRLMGGVSDENVHVGGLRCDDGCMGDVSNGEDTGRTHDSPSNLDRNHMAVREGVDTVIGDSDDTCCRAGGGACDAAGCDCAGEQTEVSDDGVDCDILGPDSRGHAVDCDFHELGVSDGGTANDSPADFRGRTGCDVVHLDGLVAYDVLWNERHKAIAKLRNITELRKCDGGYILEWDDIYKIFDVLGVDYVGMPMADVYENLRDRLIHLLGGDQPSGIDMLRAMDAESDTDGTSPNDDPTPSITDELREWASDRHCKGISHTDVLNIGLIADRIDAQFDRICQQQEAVLQSIIDEVVEERKSDRLRIEKLEKQRDEARAKLDAIRDALDG